MLRGSLISAGAVALALTVAPAVAQQGSVTTLGGYYNVSKGFDDRYFASLMGDVRVSAPLTLNAEATYLDREQNTAGFGAGFGFDLASGFTMRAGGYTSTSGSVLPDYKLYGGFDVRTDAATGLTVSPTVSYAHWRNSAEQVLVDLQVVKYFALSGAQFFALQANLKGAFSDPGSHFAPHGGAGFSYGERGRYAVGLYVEGGKASYESTAGAAPKVDYEFVAIRPRASVHVSERTQLVAVAEYSAAKIYDTVGGWLGLRFEF